MKGYFKVIGLFVFVFSTLPVLGQNMLTIYEQSSGNRSATYQQAIDFYTQLDQQFPSIEMMEAGSTDTRYPLHVVYYSQDANFDVARWKREHKIILLINNGIHPGEPDGIDASMMLLRDIAMSKVEVPENVVLAVIPVFNIGGALNRGAHSRANQDGPEQYGFRGSAQNLDLNRDFIKLDAKETRSLVRLFHRLDPDLFIDNHVSDGADYQHIMTLLETQHNKLGGATGKYQHETFVPLLYKDMKAHGYDMVPYVNDFEGTPDGGWNEFYDYPRFSSGFAALFQTMAFVPETHMLKTFKQRTDATYALMQCFIAQAAAHATEIQDARKRDREQLRKRTEFALYWAVDTTRSTSITFKGYESGYKPSDVSGQPRLYYDRSKPFTKQVPVRDHFNGTKKISAPKAYVIQQGWGDVIKRLQWNGVEMEEVQEDTELMLTVYRIDKFDSPQKPYEKHYLHRGTTVHAERQKIKLLKGDYIIPVDQQAKRYLIEVLEPTAPDAFFAWNFFDAILQQKEYFSDYVFEDMAAQMLKSNATLHKLFNDKKKTDAAFAKDGKAQLDFIYKHSQYYEPVYMRYPVFRLE